MAEARRLEEEEEELRERRELGASRRVRCRAHSSHSGADCSERNKPEHRSSSQGPLSSIRAAIKRTSRTSVHGDPHRDRRRPEITIVAAEPLRPASWFPGTPPGLGFPPSPVASPWRASELIPAELPPSYEQVIKEINQVQVSTGSNSNAPTTPRRTITSATQTDFPEEIGNSLSESNAKTTAAPGKSNPVLVVQPLKPSPLSSTNNLLKDVAPLIVFDVVEEQTCQDIPNVGTCPVPKPRSKTNLKPLVRDTPSNLKDHQETSQPTVKQEASPSQSLSLLDGNNLGSPTVINSMNTERNQASVISRIKAFESQPNAETSGLSRKPEIAPRTFPPRPAIPAGKPSVAPKPAINRASGEWDTWTENKLKVASKEGPSPQSHPPEVGGIPVTKPELPKKPKAGIVPNISNGPLDILGSRLSVEIPEKEKRIPTPAPRPLPPKKLPLLEDPAFPAPPSKPVTASPRLSVAAQARAFRSLGEGPTANSTHRPTVVEGDLISFDDDVLPAPAANLAEEHLSSEVDLDPFQLPTKAEPPKERVVQPAPTRKPTVIRIPAKPGKLLQDDPQSPPPLPAEKPIGNTSGATPGKLSNAERTRCLDSEPSLQTGSSSKGPVLPPRPIDGKVVPARPPPPKGAPGRPPPPKLSGSKVSQKQVFCRSSSDVNLQNKQSALTMGLTRAKSQIVQKQEPVLPPRPKPGHPLYKKYMLPVPHGVANEDTVSRNPGELSCKRGEVLMLLDQTEDSYLQCQKGEEIGRVHLSQMKIITPLDEYVKSRSKDTTSMQKSVDSNAPHALVLHDFPAEQADDLNLTSGETVYLLEKIDSDWYRGKCRNQTGIFPANYVKVIIDVPEGSNGKKGSISSHCVIGPRCVARFEYIGDQKDELSFSEGEMIILKEYVNDEWARGERNGKTGIFPLNFVEIIEDLSEHSTNIAADSSIRSPVNMRSNASGAYLKRDHCSGEWCEALHDFTAETNEDLPFKKGDRILIIEHLDSDWYRGRLNNTEGIFPAAFVQPCLGSIAEAKLISASGQKKEKAKALYDFHGENEDELSFKAGDIITELESVDEDWMSGERAGKSGIFPKNYIQVLQAS
ncbi:SH3 domain-containing protein 19 isoform X3 [Monodelphis domestica]|uniref:SH3 domain-containing protein 19 isoform X3 n=1 Tax=Monodelphis domestica TaxID=13616 RepID=UPI0024E22FDC|nr:SH3 domain-containing protein 19 isoform X3 [Monodelphis domestica]